MIKLSELQIYISILLAAAVIIAVIIFTIYIPSSELVKQRANIIEKNGIVCITLLDKAIDCNWDNWNGETK